MHALSLLYAHTNLDLVLEPIAHVKPLRSSPLLPPNIWSAPEKATVWKLRSRHGGRLTKVKIRMPLAHTFGARHIVTTSMGRKQYGMVLKYDMSQSSATLDPLREIHGVIKSHLATMSVFTAVMPDTTRDIASQIAIDAPTLSEASKCKIFEIRAAEKVETLFGKDSAFKVYTDSNTIVLGGIDVPEYLATDDFIDGFGGKGADPFVCLADVVVVLHAIVISPDEKHISTIIRMDGISHGRNIQSSPKND